MSLDATLQKHYEGTTDSAAFHLSVHLRADPGITVLLGASGSGKTLILNCIAGFVKPDSGRVLLNDEILFDKTANVNRTPAQRRCGYIFQDHALFPHMNVRQNLMFAAKAGLAGKSGLARRKRVSELLATFELGDLASRMPAQLSGGQKQRAALARIMVSEPQLLLLDEPTRGLDQRLRESFYDLLRSTQERLGIPVLFITHDVEECLQLADCICLLQGGRFLQCGTTEALLRAPASREAATALGIFNLLPAEIAGLDPSADTSRLRVAGTELAGPYLPGHLLGDRGTLCFLESEVELLSDEDVFAGSTLPVHIVHASTGRDGMRIRTSGGITATVRHERWERLRSKDNLHLGIRPRAMRFLV
jgi:molybdate transport system ATP-binding protein